LQQPFPFGQDFSGLPAGPKKAPFPPQSVDPKLLNKTEELINHFNDKAWSKSHQTFFFFADVVAE
jgi:hypothetical protein